MRKSEKEKKSRTSVVKDKKGDVAKEPGARPTTVVLSVPPAMQITIGGESEKRRNVKKSGG